MGRKPKKKTEISGLKLERYAAEGKSIGHLQDGKTIFVTGAIPGDEVRVYLKKNKSTFAEGVVLEIEKESNDRITPFCSHFGMCGGCKWQMLPYQKQLEYKHQQVVDQLIRLSKVDLPEISFIIGSEEDRYYRNKLEFTFSPTPYLTKKEIEAAKHEYIERTPVLGFHAPGFFDKVVDIDWCYLMNEPTNAIRNHIKEYAINHGFTFYNARTQYGWLRNLIIRISTKNEILVNLIVSEENEHLRPLLQNILDHFSEITTLCYTINNKVNDTIYDLPVHIFYGVGYIEESLESFTFRISPKSFFQTNTKQAKKLYNVVKDFAALKGDEYIYDLYCGTGSIGIFLSNNVQKMVGIEAVPDAIEDAKVNAKINKIENATFIAGDVIKIIDDDFYTKYGKPDMIITDPPRVGMHGEMVAKLLEMKVPIIIYVSCNPATQARDLALLDAVYKVTAVQPVDMFPQTHHIECVVKLELKTS